METANLSIGEIKKAAPDWTTAEAVKALQAEISGELRKGAVSAILDVHLGGILVGLMNLTHGYARLNEYTETQEKIITDLQAQLAAAKATPPPPPPAPALTTLGTLHAKSGILVVIDAEMLETSWVKKTNAQKGYVVDIVGPHAEQLAARQSHFKVVDIPGGKRVICTNTIEASAIEREADQLVELEGWTDVTAVYSKGASYVLALDATRQAGVGTASGAAPAHVRNLSGLVMGVFPTTAGTNVQLKTDGKSIIIG